MEKLYKATENGKEELSAKEYELIQLIETQQKKIEYITARQNEYPDFREYLDGVVKGDQAQIQAYIDACLAVKAKYPKPE